MPGFADSFWTPDYATGLGVLYGKLQQGVTENRQILTIASLRADAEEQYGLRMGEIAPSVDRMTATGFGKDDGASVRKVCHTRKFTNQFSVILEFFFSTWTRTNICMAGLGIRRCPNRDGRGLPQPPENRQQHSGTCRGALSPME